MLPFSRKRRSRHCCPMPLPPGKLATLRDGAVLELWPRRAGAMLFYPGTMLAPGHYYLLLRCLHAAGFTLAGMHFAGHGHAAGAACRSFGDLLAQGLAAEAWLNAHGYGPVAVMGHSQGGIFALAHAARSGSLAAAFSICAAFPQREEAIRLTRFAPLAAHRAEVMRAIKALAKIAPSLPVPLPIYLPLAKLLKGKLAPICMGRGRGRISYPMSFLASLFDAVISPKLNCPYTLFSARDDALFTPSLTRAVFEAVCAPGKKLAWLETGGHLAPFNPRLARFIAASAAAACLNLGFELNCAA